MFSTAISDLCSRKAFASTAFLTGPVDAAILAGRSLVLGKLACWVFGVLSTLLRRAPPALASGVDLPVLSGIPELFCSGNSEEERRGGGEGRLFGLCSSYARYR